MLKLRRDRGAGPEVRYPGLFRKASRMRGFFYVRLIWMRLRTLGEHAQEHDLYSRTVSVQPNSGKPLDGSVGRTSGVRSDNVKRSRAGGKPDFRSSAIADAGELVLQRLV